MNFHALRQKPFPPTLTAARQGGPAAFRAHPRAKTVLVFPRAFRALECAFHDVGSRRAATLGAFVLLSSIACNLRFVIVLLLLLVLGRVDYDHEHEHEHEIARGNTLWNNQSPPMSEVVIEPAVFEDLDELSNLLGELFSEEKDFRPDKQKQLQGLRLIFEEPNRGRVFVLRRDRTIVGMINLLFTISTAEGGFVILLEDLVVHDSFRGHGYGSKLLEYAIDFAKQKKFLRITLLTDRPELRSQNFFKRHGFFESHMLPMRLLISKDTPSPTTL